MEPRIYSFRSADAILAQHVDAWLEFQTTLDAVEPDRIVATQEGFAARGRRPKGGQSAVNHIFREELIPQGWQPEPHLFPPEREELRRWKMDFYKDEIGVEISFNHAEAMPWTFTRLNIAGESQRVVPEHRISVGIAVFATETFKAWARMDSAVGTFELARAWLDEMRPIMPIPILLIGLSADGWAPVPTAVFPGTAQGSRGGRRPRTSMPSGTLGDQTELGQG